MPPDQTGAAGATQTNTTQNAGTQAQGEAQGQGAAAPSFDFNQAFTARAQRLERSFEERLAARDAEWAKRFEELKGKPAEAQKPAGEDPHEARLRAMQKQLDDEKAARATEASERARTEERSALMSGLATLGITGARASAAAALLHTEMKTVRRDKGGRIVFAVPRDGYDDELDLTKGLAEWAKTDAGKEFLPARDAGGSGESPRRGGGPSPAGQKRRPGEALLAAILGPTDQG